jgi:hypothetical protein
VPTDMTVWVPSHEPFEGSQRVIRWGYLPPLYKKVSPSLTLSLTFKGRWV